jgi:glycosyltransferase involved in cell wall biosynthesis
MNVVHLLASPFLGGPERQVLGLARAQAATHRTTFLSFAERGLAGLFLQRARADGFDAIELRTNFPWVTAAIREVSEHLRRLRADVLLTSGYKPDVIGWRAARAAGVPVIGIAHGWTGATVKVRLYEMLDAWAMSWMDAVVCVSEATAERVRRAGVPAAKVAVIRNALDATAYDPGEPGASATGGRLTPVADAPGSPFHFGETVRFRVGAVGRLSPEKGFDVFVRAAALVARARPDVGFVVFGEGPTRPSLEELIRREGLAGRFVLAGFRQDLPAVLPGLDVAVSSSHTEGLPVAVMEAMAAGLPVVATAVGGTPEVVADGVTGLLVPVNDPAALAAKVTALLDDPRRAAMGEAGRRRVRDEFTFAAMAERYERLFAAVVPRPACRKEVAGVCG